MSTRSRFREQDEDLPPPRSKCITCLCFSWKVFTCIFSHVTLIALVVSYCVFGAFLFENLEKDNEQMVSIKAFFQLKYDFSMTLQYIAIELLKIVFN